MKALASDNPLMMEKIELEAQVSKLKLLKQSHLSKMYEMEDKIRKEYPTQIKNLEIMIDGLYSRYRTFESKYTSK